MILLERESLVGVIAERVADYHDERNHLGIGNVLVCGAGLRSAGLLSSGSDWVVYSSITVERRNETNGIDSVLGHYGIDHLKKALKVWENADPTYPRATQARRFADELGMSS